MAYVWDFSSSRLYFPARAFSNIIYGKALLLNGEYLKLLGSAEPFFEIANIFPNLLPSIYTNIYVAAANIQIKRENDAIPSLVNSLELAIPDKVYMPFVENCNYIKPLLEKLCSEGRFEDDIKEILRLYSIYEKSIFYIRQEYIVEIKPKLSEREEEIARLAVEGFSNKQIGEKLFISENTVKKHLKGVFEKLGVASRSLLVHHIVS